MKSYSAREPDPAMNDKRKTKNQLLDELERERARSDALYQVSNRLAGAHDTDEVLDLIVNEASRLLGATAAFMRLLEGDVLVARAATESAAGYLADSLRTRPEVPVQEWLSPTPHVMATKEPLVILDMSDDELVLPETRLMAEKHGFHGAALARIHRRTPMDGVRKAEGG